VLRAQRRVVDIAAGHHGESPFQAAIDHQHFFGREFGERARFVEQVLVRHDLAAAHAGFGRHDDARLCVVDAGGQRARREAAEHHRMDGADARAGEHREGASAIIGM
jgi:hypothetical protein